MAAAAVACRRGLLLQQQQQQLWQAHRWVGPARSISQLVKTNGRRAFLVDTLALVTCLHPPVCCACVPNAARILCSRGVRRNAHARNAGSLGFFFFGVGGNCVERCSTECAREK